MANPATVHCNGVCYFSNIYYLLCLFDTDDAYYSDAANNPYSTKSAANILLFYYTAKY